VGEVLPEPSDGEFVVGGSTAPVVLSDVVVGGVRLDIGEPSPDEPPGNVDAVDNADPEFRAGPVAPAAIISGVTLRFCGFDTIFNLDISCDGGGIVDGTVGDSSAFVLSIV